MGHEIFHAPFAAVAARGDNFDPFGTQRVGLARSARAAVATLGYNAPGADDTLPWERLVLDIFQRRADHARICVRYATYAVGSPRAGLWCLGKSRSVP